MFVQTKTIDMELVDRLYLEKGNYYQVYKDGRPCNVLFTVCDNGELIEVDFSSVGKSIKRNPNYYRFIPEQPFLFAIISKYSFVRMFNAVVKKITNE